MPKFGTLKVYLCINKNRNTMKNTEFNLDSLQSIISSTESLEILMEMIEDMDLEIKNIKTV